LCTLEDFREGGERLKDTELDIDKMRRQKMKECNHNFVYEEEDWRKSIISDAVLRIPVVCTECGKEADETWTDFIYTDRETGEVL